MSLPVLIYEDLAPTRDFLQDVAKVVGKLQQLFLPADPQDSQRGLEVCDDGLMSQPFKVSGETYQAFICFSLGCVELDQTSWELAHHSAQQLLEELRHWVKSKGSDQVIETPQFVTSQPQLDLYQTKNLAYVLRWSEDQLEPIQRNLTSGHSSPILLFPHHFDLSLAWFPGDDNQISLGFSTGDQDIPEPYFYLTFWPKQGNFENLPWPRPTYWNVKGFEGAVLKYADLQVATGPQKLLTALFEFGNRLAQKQI